MTAHTVLLAQTKVGFLTGGRKKSFLLLSEDEQMVQLEEAYARATVSITRARSLCLIMGPLNMKGLLGAVTVMGTLMYGAGHVWAGQAHFYLHDGELSRSPSDETFMYSHRGNLSTGIQQERRRLHAGPAGPSICGWRSSYGGGCWLTECTSKPPLGSPKKNSIFCSLTRPPDATAQTLMKRKSIVGPESKKFKHGGRDVKIGWHTIRSKVNRLSMTSRSC